ncbi:MarR family transcriptional regulator [Mesorhizobium sp. 1M-11]|uniref:MarR family winged helix-turn-helix transcriptional regulator n=1 Tax=Mesorhizobium sp. 1M-11 TaxID=1529006 RepID=UPI0006C73D48|nr:MarR family transcriptional regulator [Mesorhizobium sp. 1M-11]
MARQDDILELETFLPYRLYHLADLVSREFARVYKDRHGLTRPEWRTLSGLGQCGAMTAKALGEQSAMHKTKVSRAVAELERRRWLTRSPDEKDRRVEHLALTKAGLAAYRDMVPLAKAFERELLARINELDRGALTVALDAVEAALSFTPPDADNEGVAAGDDGRRRVRQG